MPTPVTPGAGRTLPASVAGYNTGVAASQPFAPPGYQLGPSGSTGTYYPQTTVQGTPYIPRPEFPPALPGGAAPIYVEPTTVPPARMLPKKGVPATRRVVTAIAEREE